MRWAARSQAAFSRAPGYGLFGIVQGGVYPGTAPALGGGADRRSASTAMPSAGSRSAKARRRCSRCSTRPCRRCPQDRPRYLMGVGKPDDIVGAVLRGIDMFDCVLPTRSGRTAPGLHAARHGQSAQRAAWRRSARRSTRTAPAPPARSYSPRLSASSRARRRDPRQHAVDRAQSPLLCGI